MEKSLGKVLTGKKDADDLSSKVYSRVMTLASRWISEIYEKLDDEIRGSLSRKNHWKIEKRNESKKLLDIMI